MAIELYTRSYNDVHMLPFFFRHYDRFVDRYVIYDDGSTDGTLEALGGRAKVEVRPRPSYADPSSSVRSSRDLMEQIWKESRGRADWVIVTDIDEHLHHPDLVGYLAQLGRMGVTLVPALGFQMLSWVFPSADRMLCRDVTRGAPAPMMNKLSLFAPHAIQETRFENGRHAARPTGDVRLPARDELLLLHYKYLGLEETQRRHEAYARRLRPTDVAEGWGHKYLWSRDQLEQDWAEVEANAVDISSPGFDLEVLHPHRWWSDLPRVQEATSATLQGPPSS